MCLTVNEARTNSLNKSTKKIFTFYKTFDVNFHRLESPWYEYYCCGPKEYRVEGSIKGFSGRPIDKSHLIDGLKIGEGVFHGFLKDPHKVGSFNRVLVKIKIKVRKEDFVAAGYDNEVCFKAFTITRFQWWKFWLFHGIKNAI